MYSPLIYCMFYDEGLEVGKILWGSSILFWKPLEFQQAPPYTKHCEMLFHTLWFTPSAHACVITYHSLFLLIIATLSIADA